MGKQPQETGTPKQVISFRVYKATELVFNEHTTTSGNEP
jgi:hypothetical protein